MSRLVPSQEQRHILDLGLASIRIRAGAGTGKTTTVAMIIANLVADHGVDPERILGITFTNKAAAELADRVRVDMGPMTDEGRQAEVHTYHGFAAQLLAEFGTLVGVDGRLRIITPTFARQVLSEILATNRYDQLNITSPAAVGRVRTLADRLSDHLQAPEMLLAGPEPGDDVERERLELAETLQQYERAKRVNGVVDYGDLVAFAARVMADHPTLAAQVRERYQVVVLDEYQDTNPAQRVLLTNIFGDGFPVIAVGDEDQTIYEWRGATPENFELFPLHFGTASHPVADRGLTTNRRSAQTILDVANAIRLQANPDADDLVADDQTMPGSVVTHWAADALAEADWIASRFRDFHEEGIPWNEMAVLIRKNKDFPSIVEAMRHADIPIEVANIGGLLAVPEVAELRAWLTILDRPHDSAAATQILFGSRYRLGLADIAPIARLAGKVPDGDHDIPTVSLIEAIDQPESIPGLRTAAMSAIHHFSNSYRQMLVESQGASLVETCRLVLDKTNAWLDAEALPPTRRLTARLNLYRILDLAEDWSPLSGRPSLTAFLDYLQAMEEEPAEELDAARLSGEDAVTLVTVHRAKGLEWEVVAVPCLTDRNFPSSSPGGFPDPIRFPQHLPPRYRIDSALANMPADHDGRMAFFRAANSRQEWRVAYVAATRAKRHLLATGANWYGRPEPNMNAKKPSELFELIAGHPAASNADHAPVDTPRPEVLTRLDDIPSPDPLFPGGWAASLRGEAESDKPTFLADKMGVTNELSRMIDRHRQTLFDIEEYVEPKIENDIKTVSVTGLVTYARCPKRYFWSEVEPLPRRRNPAAEAGTDLHRRIELFQRGQVPFEDVSHELYDAPGEISGEGGWKAFADSRFASAEAALIEAPFSIALTNGFKVRGRIDAVYVSDGSWEIVDFKSGTPKTDDARLVQLQAYAVAAQRSGLGLPIPEKTTVTFAYLGGGLHEDSYLADPEWIADAQEHLDTLTGQIENEEFGETPGDHCRNCDFIRFCPPGTEWLAAR